MEITKEEMNQFVDELIEEAMEKNPIHATINWIDYREGVHGFIYRDTQFGWLKSNLVLDDLEDQIRRDCREQMNRKYKVA